MIDASQILDASKSNGWQNTLWAQNLQLCTCQSKLSFWDFAA